MSPKIQTIGKQLGNTANIVEQTENTVASAVAADTDNLSTIESAKDLDEQAALAQGNHLLDEINKIFNDLKEIPKTSEVIAKLAELLEPLKKFIVDPCNYKLDSTKSISEQIVVMAHNAFNRLGTGMVSAIYGPNQYLSIKQLLQTGVRAFELDVYSHNNDFLLCHALCNAQTGLFENTLNLIFGSDQKLTDILKQMNDFLIKNPTEALVVKMEDYVAGKEAELIKTIKQVIDPKLIFTEQDYINSNHVFPSIDDMIKNGKQIIFLPQNGNIPELIHTGFQESSGVKYYYGFNDAKKSGYKLFKHFAGQISEVGEDNTIVGKALDKAGLSEAGILTRDGIDKIQKENIGGIFFSSDQLGETDSRYVKLKDDVGGYIAGCMVALSENAWVFVPVAMLAGALAPDKDKIGWMPQATRTALQLLMFSLLPTAGAFLYLAADGAVSEFKKPDKEQLAGKMAMIEKLAFSIGKGLYSSAGNLITTSVIALNANMMLRSASKDEDPSIASSLMATLMASVAVRNAPQIIKNTSHGVGYLVKKGWRVLSWFGSKKNKM
jgi:hypothetical protein